MATFTDTSLITLLNDVVLLRKGIVEDEKDINRLKDKYKLSREIGLVEKEEEYAQWLVTYRAAKKVLEYFEGPALVNLIQKVKSENNVAWSWINKELILMDP